MPTNPGPRYPEPTKPALIKQAVTTNAPAAVGVLAAGAGLAAYFGGIVGVVAGGALFALGWLSRGR